MAHLHPDFWRDLEPEFAAAEYLTEAQKTLRAAPVDTACVAGCLARIHDALMALHPATRDDGAIEEFKQRSAGTYDAGPRGRPAQQKGPDKRDQTIADLNARLKALEKSSKQPPGELTKDP